MNTAATVLVGVGVALGLVGVLVPFLPGTLLVWISIGAWAAVTGGATGWLTLAAVSVVLAATLLVKYLIPTRRLARADVARTSLLAGALLGVVGFFVVPVVGLVLGFIGGIFGAELVHRRSRRRAWAATVHAARAVLLATGIELAGGLLAAAVWLGVLIGR